MTAEEKKILKEKQIKSGNEIGVKNLKPLTELPPEEAKAIRQKGQAAATQKKKDKKKIKDICNDLLSLPAEDLAKAVLNEGIVEKLKDVDLTVYDLIVAKQIEQTLTTGSVKSAEFIRDSAGDKPTEKIQAQVETITDFDRELMNNLSSRIDSLEAIETTGKVINDPE